MPTVRSSHTRAPTVARRAAAAVLVVVAGSLAGAPPAHASNAPSTPELITPTAGGSVNGGPGQLFTVRAVDPQGDPYQATIEVTTANATFSFDTAWAQSNTEATGTPSPQTPIPPGTHTWRARAKDLSGNLSATSAARSFTVSPPPNNGVGQVSGEVLFGGAGQPGILQDCAETTFTIGNTVTTNPTTVDEASNGIILNISGSVYSGPFSLSGTGQGACANAVAGSGTLAVEVTGQGPTGGRIHCSLSGHFARVLANVEVALSGVCTINNNRTGNVIFRAQVLFRPDPGQGLTTPVMRAVFAGFFTVTPG